MSNTYEIIGKIKLITDTQKVTEKFSKREFVVTTPDEKYPQDVKLELVNDNCAKLDSFSEGQEVKVGFNLRGNEFKGKYYVSLSAWKIEAVEPF